MRGDFKILFVVFMLLSTAFAAKKKVPKKKKYKATTEILGDRIISLSENILRMTLELPAGEGRTLVEQTESLNSCIRQFVRLIYENDYMDKDIQKVLDLGPQPKFLEVELNEKKLQTARERFGWGDKEIDDWFFQRLCTYQHWNHILTYKNHYTGMK